MKYLIIDSHKGGSSKPTSSLHWANARQIADRINADMIWSYPGVNDNIQSGYDAIIFNHASHYSYVDYAWLEASPNAKLFYITNEYNLGEPRALWMAIKRANRRYQVIANHPAAPSKIVKKYTEAWHILNLNSLSYKPSSVFDAPSSGSGVVYWGSFREDRAQYFQKYLTSGYITISTHQKNQEKFRKLGVNGPFMKRLDWTKHDIQQFKYSLYIEDITTHTHFNFLANRFYEALNEGVLTIFDTTCRNTIEKSGYAVPDSLVIDSVSEIKNINPDTILTDWHDTAEAEKHAVLNRIQSIVEDKSVLKYY